MQEARPAPPLAGVVDDAVSAAKKKYPRIAKIPFKLTKGTGPYMSETYEPEDDDNPAPGNWTVQLRDKSVVNDPSKWEGYIALESIHALQAADPKYQKFTEQFIASMTPQQKKQSRKTFALEQKESGAKGQFAPTEEAYQKWLRHVQAQEYIRGGIFTDTIPNWIGPKGEGGYTPEQMKLLGQIDRYLKTSD